MKSATGKAHQILGHGSNAMFCHAVLRLTLNPTPSESEITCAPDCSDVDPKLLERCRAYLQSWVDGYRTEHEIELSIEIIEIKTDPERNNDYERGLNLAMRDALEHLGLPTPQIFAP